MKKTTKLFGRRRGRVVIDFLNVAVGRSVEI
jgi:hypothetical protein